MSTTTPTKKEEPPSTSTEKEGPPSPSLTLEMITTATARTTTTTTTTITTTTTPTTKKGNPSSPTAPTSSFQSSTQPTTTTATPIPAPIAKKGSPSSSTPSTFPSLKATDPTTTNPLTGNPFSGRYSELLGVRKELPIWPRKYDFLKLLRENQVVVLVGETGSGKTTQVPAWCLDLPSASAPFHVVACTQPRRVAATSVAQRVAEEMDVVLGEEVGYCIRFDDCSSPRTRIRYMTDGMLLRETMQDPMLTRYSTILLDEAHERTLATDILLGVVKGVARQRKDLKIVVMSATLDAEKFQTYFDGAPLIVVKGRTHPVEIFYTAEPQKDYLVASVDTVLGIHKRKEEGDVLLFLTGEEEIEDACRKIRRGLSPLASTHGQATVLPLYSSLPPQMQMKVFQKVNGRKIVVSTNIAETSVTIDGIVYVVDPGFVKMNVFNPRTRMESLLVTPVSQAAAMQRAGRAGRTRPGRVYRLYPESVYVTDLQAQTPPEILRSNLANVVLQMLGLGISDLVHFDFIDPPAPETLMRALELLHHLGAVDEKVTLTPIGRHMAYFPLDPELAKILLEAPRLGCLDEALTVVAMLSVPNVFVRPHDAKKESDAAKARFAQKDSDHLTLLHVYEAYVKVPVNDQQSYCYSNYLNHRALKSAVSVRTQLSQLSDRIGLYKQINPAPTGPLSIRLRRCLVLGYLMHVAHIDRTGQYVTLGDNQEVVFHPSSNLIGRPDWVIYHENILTTRHYIRTVTAVDGGWLLSAAPEFFDPNNFPKGESRTALKMLQSSRKNWRGRR